MLSVNKWNGKVVCQNSISIVYTGKCPMSEFATFRPPKMKRILVRV